MAKFRGNITLYTAKGTVTVGATAFADKATSAAGSDDSPIAEVNDAGGVPRTQVMPYQRFTYEFTLRPSAASAATLQALVGVASIIPKFTAITTAFTQCPALTLAAGDKAYVTASRTNEESEGPGSITLTVTRWVDDAGAAIDFGSSWTTV